MLHTNTHIKACTHKAKSSDTLFQSERSTLSVGSYISLLLLPLLSASDGSYCRCGSCYFRLLRLMLLLLMLMLCDTSWCIVTLFVRRARLYYTYIGWCTQFTFNTAYTQTFTINTLMYEQAI